MYVLQTARGNVKWKEISLQSLKVSSNSTEGGRRKREQEREGRREEGEEGKKGEKGRGEDEYGRKRWGKERLSERGGASWGRGRGSGC